MFLESARTRWAHNIFVSWWKGCKTWLQHSIRVKIGLGDGYLTTHTPDFGQLMKGVLKVTWVCILVAFVLQRGLGSVRWTNRQRSHQRLICNRQAEFVLTSCPATMLARFPTHYNITVLCTTEHFMNRLIDPQGHQDSSPPFFPTFM